MSHLELPAVVVERGRTVALRALPPRSIALDGYVQGPEIDTEHERYSFDHHAGCVRHATLSTCEMVLDALRVGLDASRSTVYVNDLDADSILATWLLLRPGAADEETVASAVRAAGRFDALGPADPGPGLVPALRWALEPSLDAFDDGTLRTLSDDGLRALLLECLARLDAWRAAGAPVAAVGSTPRERRVVTLEVLHRADLWGLVRTRDGVRAYARLYRDGWRAAVLACPLGDGTTAYTVGKASEFVRDFDVPAILAALRDAELAANAAQDRSCNWGGGSAIGGSPRNRDGSSSRLVWTAVVEVVERARRGAR